MARFSEETFIWREIKNPPAKSPNRSLEVFHLLIPFLIASLLYLFNKHLFAMIVLGIGLLLLLLKFIMPRSHEFILLLMSRFAEWLATVLSTLFLSLVYGLIFTPVAVTGRLLGLDPLRLKWLPPSRSYWSRIPEGMSARFFDKPFLAEAGAAERPGRSRKIFRLVKALYLIIVTLFLLNLGGGYLFNKMEKVFSERIEGQRYNLSVYDGKPWARAYFREFSASRLRTYAPFLGWRRPDFSGRYININHGERKTYQAADPSHPGLKIHMFGASAMWGTGARDEYTIPSCLARIADEDGLPLQIRNFGEAAYVSWQGVLRLAELCALGDTPDMVIFYDGPADVIAKIESPSMKRAHLNMDQWEELAPVRVGAHKRSLSERCSWLIKYSLVHCAGKALGGCLKDEREKVKPVWDSDEIQRLARELTATYHENIGFVQMLGQAFHFETFFFWQPILCTKANPSGEEKKYKMAYGSGLSNLFIAARDDVQAENLAIDLSDVFGSRKQTLYIDRFHLCEEGNQIIAEKMYEHIKPVLESRVILKQGVSQP